MPIILLNPGRNHISILGPRNLSILEVTLDGEAKTFYKDNPRSKDDMVCIGQYWLIEATPLGRLQVTTNKSTYEYSLC